MGDVKPWEPVNVQYTDSEGWSGTNWTWDEDAVGDVRSAIFNEEGEWCVTITLANNQKIIVRALSEERKAARRARMEGK